MTSYAELDRIRRQARPLYLELCALGLGVAVYEDLNAPTGYRLELMDSKSLSSQNADRLQRRIDEEATPSLLKVLWTRWDADILAVLEEGRCR